MTVTLVGYDTTVTYDGGTCRLRFRESGTGGSLRSRLGELHVPVTALAGTRLRVPGVLRSGRLTLIPRTGADPFTAVAGTPLADDVSPFGIDYSPDNEPAAVMLARRLKTAIARSGLATAPADEFLVEFTRLPVTARGSDGWAEFDGERVTLLRFGPVERTHTMPLTALRSVRWVDDRDHAYLRFTMIGDGADDGRDDGRGAELDPRRLHHETAEDKASTLVLAAAVTAALRRLHGGAGTGIGTGAGMGTGGDTGIGIGTAEDTGLPHGLRVDAGPGGTVTRLYGLGGEAEFDGTAVTVRTHGTARRIPLPAIDELELGESRTGVGYVRLRLAGAGPADLAVGRGVDDPAADPMIDQALDPVLDVNTLCHGNEPAALEFTLRVTEALRGVTRVPDRDLLAAAGPPADIADALARASVRVRGLVPELAALPSVLRPGERVRELDLAVSGDAGLLVVTGDRLLFLAAGQPYGDPLAIALSRVTDVRATWDGGHVGRLRFLLRGGDEAVFDGVHDPARFRALPDARAAVAGELPGDVPGDAPGQARDQGEPGRSGEAGEAGMAPGHRPPGERHPGEAAPAFPAAPPAAFPSVPSVPPPSVPSVPPPSVPPSTSSSVPRSVPPSVPSDPPGPPPAAPSSSPPPPRAAASYPPPAAAPRATRPEPPPATVGDVERAPTARAEEPAPPAPARAPEPAARNGDGAGGAGAGGRLGGAPGSHEVERSLLRVGRRPSPIGNPRALRADVRAARSRAGERARRGRRELDDLLDALPETEEVYELDAAVAHGQDGLLLLTDLRLLFLSGDELLSIPMEAVVKVTASDPAEELIVTAADGLWFRFAEVPGAARFARLIEARSGLRSRPGSSAPGR